MLKHTCAVNVHYMYLNSNLKKNLSDLTLLSSLGEKGKEEVN